MVMREMTSENTRMDCSGGAYLLMSVVAMFPDQYLRLQTGRWRGKDR